MKHSLPFLLVSTLCASVALAEPPVAPPSDTQKAATALVQKKLVEPLTKSESHRSRFSRGAPVAARRRVRVLDALTQTDVHGRSFVRFAIDARYPGGDEKSWIEDSITGCVYPADHKVFVQEGDDYLPAAAALGDDAEPAADVCRAAPAGAAQVASATRS